MAEETTVPLKKDTRKRLKVYCAERDMTYDEAINDLLDEVKD
jgi:hypothetical protein